MPFSTGLFIREDTAAREVYVFDESLNPHDQLLYDFSLNVGDTLHSQYNGNGTLVLTSIENITLNDGAVRKSLTFSNAFGPAGSYTASIGGSYGLFYPIEFNFSSQHGYFCIKENGINLLGSSCDYPYVGIPVKTTKELLSILVDPSESSLKIHIYSPLHNIKLSLYSLSGQLILSESIIEKETKVNLHGLSEGSYFALVHSDEETVKSRIFIQQE